MEPSSLGPTWIRFVPDSCSGASENSSKPKGAAQTRFCCCWGPCSACFEKSDQLKSHLLDAHVNQEVALVCRVVGCLFEGAEFSSLIRHVLFHFYHAVRQCRGMELLSSDQRTVHVRHCNSRRPEARRPNAILFPGTVMQCLWDECFEMFDDVSAFSLHINYHISTVESEKKKRIYKCKWTDCTYSSCQKSRLREHVAHHSGDKPLACPFCGEFFCQATKLRDHVIRFTDAQGSRFKCFYCQKQFPNERLLREHGRRHINRYKCPFCDMTVVSPHELRAHIQARHSDTREFKCTICDKSFLKAHDLKRHFAMHSDSKMFSCSQCEKVFKWERSLREHSKLHNQSQLWPYACHLCEQQYRSGANLTHHLKRVHHAPLAPGHSRFQYKKCSDGLLRLQTERQETPELASAFQRIQMDRAAGLAEPIVIPVQNINHLHSVQVQMHADSEPKELMPLDFLQEQII